MPFDPWNRFHHVSKATGRLWHYVTALMRVCVYVCNIMIMITTDSADVKKTKVEKNDLLFSRKRDREG